MRECEYTCRDCKWLDMDQKTSVGYVCVNKNRKMVEMSGGRRNLSHLKYPSTRACKTGFELKEGGRDVRKN